MESSKTAFKAQQTPKDEPAEDTELVELTDPYAVQFWLHYRLRRLVRLRERAPKEAKETEKPERAALNAPSVPAVQSRVPACLL